jgi:flagellar hook-associated protein 3 FlgL
MRVTFAASFQDVITEVNRTSQQLATAEQQVSSNRRVSKPSDDPTAASGAVTDYATLSSLDAYTAAADAATSRLTIVDSALSDIVNQLSAAQTAVLSAKGTVQNQSQREAAAAKLQGISDALLGDFNVRFQGTSLFGGTLATTSPFTKSGGTVSAYQGNGATVNFDVGGGRLVAGSLSGGAIAQGSEASDIFTVLSNLVTAVKSGDDGAIEAGSSALQRAFDRATLAQTQVGTSLAALDDARASLSTARLNTKAQLSEKEDANMAAAIVQMNKAYTAYQAALSAFSKIGSLSLMDYLR